MLSPQRSFLTKAWHPVLPGDQRPSHPITRLAPVSPRESLSGLAVAGVRVSEMVGVAETSGGEGGAHHTDIIPHCI